jgi:hypothetical protein
MTFSLAQTASKLAIGLRGGATYAVALATGDMAADDVVGARRAICRECPSRTRKALPGMTSESDWCGEPLQERFDAVPPTCGCSVGLKSAVGSERCPQGKWEER